MSLYFDKRRNTNDDRQGVAAESDSIPVSPDTLYTGVHDSGSRTIGTPYDFDSVSGNTPAPDSRYTVTHALTPRLSFGRRLPDFVLLPESPSFTVLHAVSIIEMASFLPTKPDFGIADFPVSSKFHR